MFACYKYTAPTGLGGGACKPAATNMPPLRGLAEACKPAATNMPPLRGLVGIP
ncbi:Uncharacterized protein dnm_040220 [Desulfonema magnum]|uniref:Uncharacterized protein n=1 Tax=Desulfonema magnum TaxID=45655 RepID=A0A975BLY0_9BACT|nr:Uncharacterized protein dnm_040220 [Desulfonema magnum]